MPVEVKVTYADGSEELVYIPLQMMRWEKPAGENAQNRTVEEDWAWAYPTYYFVLDRPETEIQSLEIDDSMMMADVDRTNNVYPPTEEPAGE